LSAFVAGHTHPPGMGNIRSRGGLLKLIGDQMKSTGRELL